MLDRSAGGRHSHSLGGRGYAASPAPAPPSAIPSLENGSEEKSRMPVQMQKNVVSGHTTVDDAARGCVIRYTVVDRRMGVTVVMATV